MKSEKDILDEVEKTLEAFDRDIILKENPFLFTRIEARLNSIRNKRKNAFRHHPVLSRVILILIIVLNLFTLAYFYGRGEDSNLQDKMYMELISDFQIDESSINY